MLPLAYVLVTPAHNEERLIARTIESVLSQTRQPKRWVIVSDASTDHTDEIVKRYAGAHSFIHLTRVTEPHPRGFASRINALNVGCRLLQDTSYDLIGTVDADVTFDENYFGNLVAKFEADPRLGLAGGALYEAQGGSIKALPRERFRSVANAAQLLRRGCYDEIGGYPLLPYGGPDTYAEFAARMKGWRVETFTDLIAHHHRSTASASGLINGRFRQGMQDFSFGYHPLFEAVKCLRRLGEKPIVLGATARMVGFCWSYLWVRHPAVSDEFVQFLRSEQLQRLRTLS